MAGSAEERRTLLRDLHDSVGPTLAAAALGIRAVRNLLHRDRAAAEQILTRLEDELHSAIAEIRRLANGVHPPVLDRLGLVGAVRQYAETLGSRLATAVTTTGGTTGGTAGPPVRIEVEVCGELPVLPPAVEVAAYRIVCEALTNVGRHSDARLCTVRLWFDGELQLEIVDDGNGGVAPTRARSDQGADQVAGRDRPGGVGLGSMRERARTLGGTLAVEPVTRGGTRVAATLPVSTG